MSDTPRNPDHHLDYKHGWRVRLSIGFDKRLVGNRIYVPLQTRDIAVARRRRDFLLTVLKTVGLLAPGSRVQKKVGNQSNNNQTT